MANKGTKRRLRELAKQPFVTGGYKKKKKDFPNPSGADSGISLCDQRKMLGYK